MAGIAAAGALLLEPTLLGGLRIQPTPDMESTIVVQGPVVEVVALLLVVLAGVVLVRGVRGEPGLLRASRAAGIAMLVAVGASVALAVARALVGMALGGPGDPALPSGVVLLTLAAGAIRAGALAVLAVMVVRGRLLEPVARVSLAVLALATAASCLFETGLGALLPGGTWSPWILLLVALPTVTLLASAGLGVGLLVHGRSAAMRERAATIRRAW